MSWSIWEKEMIRPEADVLIVGSGITGLTTAWFLKRQHPELDILVLDRSMEGTGASTRNAGFACMGSLGELVSDSHQMGVDAATELYKRRWNGLQLLQQILPAREIDLVWCGGYELFFEGQEDEWEEVCQQIAPWNERIQTATGISSAFQQVGEGEWGNWTPPTGIIGAIRHAREGRLHSGKMVRGLIDRLLAQGVRFQSGVEVKQIECGDQGATLTDRFGRTWKGERLVLATNAFTRDLLPNAEVTPARNQVLLTAPVKNHIPDACFHVEQGYIYFRRYGDRILIGGARNRDPEGETTQELGENRALLGYLQEFADRLTGEAVSVELSWSGIIGVGEEKAPLVQRLDQRMVLAARLSGMGVALGSAIGRDAARLILE